LQVGCSPPANSFWPLGHPIPSPHFTYEARGAGIQLQRNFNLLCYKKTLENLVTSSSSLKKEETKNQVVKQVARAVSLRATTLLGRFLDTLMDKSFEGMKFLSATVFFPVPL
jgi:hypothetical protein